MEEGAYIGQYYDSLSARWKRSIHQIRIVIIGLDKKIKDSFGLSARDSNR